MFVWLPSRCHRCDGPVEGKKKKEILDSLEFKQTSEVICEWIVPGELKIDIQIFFHKNVPLCKY